MIYAIIAILYMFIAAVMGGYHYHRYGGSKLYCRTLREEAMAWSGIIGFFWGIIVPTNAAYYLVEIILTPFVRIGAKFARKTNTE